MSVNWLRLWGKRAAQKRRRHGRRPLTARPIRLETLEPRMLLNVAPAAGDDFTQVGSDQPALLDFLLANDRGETPLAIGGFTQPGHATVLPAAGDAVLDNHDGTLIYVPDAGFVGEDSFSYTIVDGRGGLDAATVRLLVERAVGDMRIEVGAAAGDAAPPAVAAAERFEQGATVSDVWPMAAEAGTLTPSEIRAVLGDDVPTSTAGLPLLHSLIGAPVAIFLDFDGWDWVEPYDVDGDSATFDAAEQATIVEAWRNIATTFAMFNVDVTTEQPDFAAVPTNYEIIGNNISGGYSYLTFPSTTPKGFNAAGNARSRLTGIAHEIGHNFSLRHQSDYDLLGERTKEYSSGDKDLHVPLMGVDYSGRLPQLYVGHSSRGPDRLQDDVAVIAGKVANHETGGDGFRPDDVADSTAGAALLTPDGTIQSGAGIIERYDDVDVFSFTTDGKAWLVSARPDYPSAADLKLEIFTAADVLLAAEDGPQNGQDLLVELPAGTYYAVVSSHGDGGDLGVYRIEARPMPGGWNTQDVGPIAVTGYATGDDTGGAFTVAGSGYDISSDEDSFRYVYQTLDGDGRITAHVTSITDTHDRAKAGVMIRETLEPDAKNVLAAVTADRGVVAQRRSSTGGSTSSTTDSGYVAPYWVRLTRTGDSFTVERSADGAVFSEVNTLSVSMSQQVYVGLAVTSRKKKLLNVATFDNVSLEGNLGWPLPPINALPAPADLAATLGTASPAAGGTATDVNLSWTSVAGATGYLVERSQDNLNWTDAGTTTADIFAYTDAGLFGSMRYFYRISTLDGSGQSLPSPSVTVVNRPGAVAGATVTSWKTDTLILNWTDVSGDTGYRIERSADGVTFTAVDVVGPNVPLWVDAGLTMATSYHYRIVPLSPQGDGPATTLSGSTRLPPVTGLAFTSKTPELLAFEWDPVDGATAYRIERSSKGSSFSTLATVSGVAAYAHENVTPVDEYYYRVFGLGGGSQSEGTATIFAAAPWDQTMPVPWDSRDVGSVAGSGAASLSGGIFTQVAAGNTLGSSQDAFRFTYRTLEGDGQITARVATQEDTHDRAKAGVMFRESLNANSRNVFMMITPDDGTAMQWRSSSGGSTSDTVEVDADAPYWLRLTRSGSTFTGERSSDGVTWELVGSASVGMSQSVYVGLASNSHETDELNTSTFDNVTVDPAGNTAPTADDDLLTVHQDATADVSVTDNDADADADLLVIVQFSQGAHGSVSDGGDGTLIYTPKPGYVGADSFHYTITDGRQGYDSATVDVRVLGLLYHWRFDESEGLAAAEEKGLAAGTLTAMTGEEWTAGHYGGGLAMDGVNDYVATAVNLNETLGGTASLAFWINTTATGSNTRRDAPGVTGSEKASSGNDIQWGWIDGSGRLRISAGGNDGATTSEPINDGLWHHVALTRDADTGQTQVFVDGRLDDVDTAGTASLAAGGTGVKTTDFSDVGRIFDTAGTHEHLQGSLDDVRVYNFIIGGEEADLLARNGPPVARADIGATSEDLAVELDVLANDGDPEDDPLHVTDVLTPPAHGRVEINPGGSLTYTPDRNFAGTDSFVYRIADATGQHARATVDLEVASVNDSPEALPDVAYTEPGMAVAIAVLANDADADLDVLVLENFTQGTDGTVSLTAGGTATDNLDGTLTYTPGGGFSGTDAFVYTIGDGHGEFDSAVVTVGVGTELAFQKPVDTYLQQGSPTRNNSAATELNVDAASGGGQVQTLMLFDGLFGPAADQVPPGATIHRATLQLRVTNPGDSIELHRMVRTWQDTDTWDSLGDGVQADDVEAVARADLATGPVATGTLSIDVTGAVQRWANDPSTNRGWAMLPTDDNGVDFYSAEGSTGPSLSVQYIDTATTPAQVVARHVFYNNSTFDGSDPAADGRDDDAIATDKEPLLPGTPASIATPANYTSYSRGINGIMVDLVGLPDGVVPGPADFAFRVGNDDTPADWAVAAAPGSTLFRKGAGLDGSDRVTFVWEDGLLRNTWLQVTVKADALGLADDDIFYFGNAVAEAGNSPANFHVTVADLLLARNNPRDFTRQAEITFAYDYDRDGNVNSTDVLLARNNQTSFFTALRPIDLSGESAATAPAVSPQQIVWLSEFTPSGPRSQPTLQQDLTPEAVDRLLAR